VRGKDCVACDFIIAQCYMQYQSFRCERGECVLEALVRCKESCSATIDNYPYATL
jgi:hypothetical protein